MWQMLPDMLSSLSSHLLPQAAIALANPYLTAKPKRGLSLLSLPSGPGQRKSCSLRGLCSGQHAASTQAAEPAAEHAGTCSLAASPSVLHATRLTLQAPTQPSPAGEAAQLHPDAPGCGGGSCHPVPGCANLRLVEQYYKYVLLRDLVTQPRSRKGMRCHGASPPQPRCLHSTARSARVSPSPGSRGGHWAAEQGGGGQSSGWIVQASAGDISATSTERGQCQLHESHFCPLQPPFFFRTATATFLHKHSSPKTTSYRAAKPLQRHPYAHTHIHPPPPPRHATHWPFCTS